MHLVHFIIFTVVSVSYKNKIVLILIVGNFILLYRWENLSSRILIFRQCYRLTFPCNASNAMYVISSALIIFFRYHRLRDFPFREVFLAGIFLGIVTPPPVISNGPPQLDKIVVKSTVSPQPWNSKS